MRIRVKTVLSSLLAAAALAGSVTEALCCSRAVYLSKNNIVVTTRSMDWMEDLHSNLWVFPRGMKRNGAAGAASVEWVSKYGSIATSAYEAGTADGLNEKGLSANLLYLAESDYGKADGSKPTMSLSAWAQYVLDNYATVEEAVSGLGKNSFQLVCPVLPNGKADTVHLSVSDPTGDSAIFECLDGKLKIHHDRKYQVMTNSPSFDQQLALNSYWEGLAEKTFLPGTHRPADRFARASY